MAIQEIMNPLTDPPAVPVVAEGQDTFNTKASAWLSYWKNNVYVELTSLLTKLNVFRSEVNTVRGEINTVKEDVVQLKEDTQTVKEDVVQIKEDTEDIKDNTLTVRNETIAYIDATFGSSVIWSENNVVGATHTVSNLDIVRVDATALGVDVVITLPTSPNNRDVIEFVNADLVRTNTVLIARGSATHLIDGKLENGEFNCNCVMKLQFDSITDNWIKG